MLLFLGNLGVGEILVIAFILGLPFAVILALIINSPSDDERDTEIRASFRCSRALPGGGVQPHLSVRRGHTVGVHIFHCQTTCHSWR